MPEFKVGDRFRLKRYTFLKGTILEIVDNGGIPFAWIQMDDAIRKGCSQLSDLEIIEDKHV